MSDKTTIHEIQHRRSSTFIDEFVDRFSAMAISWNGDERVHITFGRDSLEVLTETIVPDPEDSGKAMFGTGRTAPYRNNVASLTIPVDVAEKLGITLLRMVENARKRELSESSE